MIRSINAALGILCLAAVCSPLAAQELTVSPYSRYAIGDVFSATTVRNASMGGIGVASDNYFSINRVNPATLADLVYTTSDLSVFGQVSRMSTANSRSYPVAAGLHDMSFAFPSNKGLVLGLGFAPYSGVGYTIDSRQDVLLGDSTFVQRTIYTAKGGLSQAYLTAAYRMLHNRLRIGASFNFLFGNTTYTWSNVLYANDTLLAAGYLPITAVRDQYARGVNPQIGILYSDTLNKAKNIHWRIGATAEFPLAMKANRFTEYSNTLVRDSVGVFEEGEILLPRKVGIGFMINRPAYWSVGADVVWRDWTNFTFLSDSLNLGRELRASIGGEFTPNPEVANYLKRINYRAGAYAQQTYINFGGDPVYDYGVTFGVGIPATFKGNSRFQPGRVTSRINIGAELGRRGNINLEQPVEEYYVRLRLGFTINEQWFVKRVFN
ncbi:MAG: hypothetical protein SF053_07370 [Bacteroidia bacterium]|nr:hypothetical protein [Bacteroidia bacterium]